MSALTGNQSINVEAARNQRAQVLYMLKKGMKISQIDVEKSPFFIRRLASRICELRALGFPIQKTIITQDGVAGMAQYSLTETPADTRNKRLVLDRLLKGEILNAENVLDLSEKELDRVARWLRADGWPVLILRPDGVKMPLYVMVLNDGD